MTLSTLRLSNAALIVVEHERRLDVVGERRHLLLVEEVLLRRAKTRSQEAESGAMAKTMRARRQRPGGEPTHRVIEVIGSGLSHQEPRSFHSTF